MYSTIVFVPYAPAETVAELSTDFSNPDAVDEITPASTEEEAEIMARQKIAYSLGDMGYVRDMISINLDTKTSKWEIKLSIHMFFS